MRQVLDSLVNHLCSYLGELGDVCPYQTVPAVLSRLGTAILLLELALVVTHGNRDPLLES